MRTWRSFHTLSIFPQGFDALWHPILLHILTEFHRPSVAVRYGSCLSCLLIALDQLTHWIQRQVIILRLARWVIPGRCVFEVDVLEVIIQELANVVRDWLLVKASDFDAMWIKRFVWLFDHLVEHIRCWELIPGSCSVAVILW